MSVNEKMTAIADNIRSKTGATEALTLDDMASGVNEVHSAGKKNEYDAFWDAVQNNGARIDYKYAFAYNSWTPNNFFPKYDIKPTGDGGQYILALGSHLNIDLDKRLKEQGVVLDFSGLTSSECEFYLSKFTNLPTLDFSGCSAMNRTFDYYTGRSLTLILSDSGETVFTTIFRRCSKLTDIVIESGTIGKTLNVSDSPLNVASATSIITHLKEYAGTENAGKYTLTFKDTTKTALQEAGALGELGGKTYDAYIADIGWNLA